MKVANTITTIQIDKEEWQKVKKDWEKIKYANKPLLFQSADIKALYEFLEFIEIVQNNPAHSIDRKLNSF